MCSSNSERAAPSCLPSARSQRVSVSPYRSSFLKTPICASSQKLHECFKRCIARRKRELLQLKVLPAYSDDLRAELQGRFVIVFSNHLHVQPNSICSFHGGPPTLMGCCD